MNIRLKAVVAAVVLIVPVVAQLVYEDLDDREWGHLLFAGSQLLGWALLVPVCRALDRRPVPGRAARAGSRLVQIACWTQCAFAVAYGILALTSGDPEPAFVIYLLGFLALTVGGVLWGRALTRDHATRTAGRALISVAVLGFLAMAIGTDPLHDVFLLSSFAAWAAVGVGVPRTDEETPRRHGAATVGG
jgi:hypothetical protein